MKAIIKEDRKTPQCPRNTSLSFVKECTGKPLSSLVPVTSVDAYRESDEDCGHLGRSDKEGWGSVFFIVERHSVFLEVTQKNSYNPCT